MFRFVASFLTLMTVGGFPSFVEDMKVFGRERLNGHYWTGAFVVSNTLSSALYLLLVSLVPGIISYYLPGLHAGINCFLYFILMLFVCLMLVESLMMIVASLVPSYLMAIIIGVRIQGLMILGGGFFRLPDDLPGPFLKYPLCYIAFHRYAYQGMLKNEFEGLKFPSQPGGCGGIMIDREQILREIWEVEMGHSKGVDLEILVGMVVAYRLLLLGIVKTSEVVRPRVAALMAVTQKPAVQAMESPNPNT